MILTERNLPIFVDGIKELAEFYESTYDDSETNIEIAISNDLGDFLEYIHTFLTPEKQLALGTEIPCEKCTQGLIAAMFTAQTFLEIGEQQIAKNMINFVLLFRNNKVMQLMEIPCTNSNS